jgi:hypothetical protein
LVTINVIEEFNKVLYQQLSTINHQPSTNFLCK